MPPWNLLHRAVIQFFDNLKTLKRPPNDQNPTLKGSNHPRQRRISARKHFLSDCPQATMNSLGAGKYLRSLLQNIEERKNSLLSIIPSRARIIFLLDRDSLSRHIYNSNCMPAFLGRSIRHDANAMQPCKYIKYGSVSACLPPAARMNSLFEEEKRNRLVFFLSSSSSPCQWLFFDAVYWKNGKLFDKVFLSFRLRR